MRHIMVLDRAARTNDSRGKSTYILLQFIEVLEKFADNFDKRLNFDKLVQHLNLSSSEAENLLSTLFSFQSLFTHSLNGYTIQKRIIDNHCYLIPEKNPDINHIPKKIVIREEQLNILSDIIYIFKFVKKGKGFDVDTNGTDLLSRMKQLCDYHPFLFQRHNGLLYPSEFGLKLGELILSYKKSNRPIELFILDEHEVRVG
jgi:hypothetical protein